MLFARVACNYMVCWETIYVITSKEEINSTSMFTVNQVTIVPEVEVSIAVRVHMRHHC